MLLVLLCGGPLRMNFSLLLVGVAFVNVVITVAGVLFFVNRPGRD